MIKSEFVNLAEELAPDAETGDSAVVSWEGQDIFQATLLVNGYKSSVDNSTELSGFVQLDFNSSDVDARLAYHFDRDGSWRALAEIDYTFETKKGIYGEMHVMASLENSCGRAVQADISLTLS